MDGLENEGEMDIPSKYYWILYPLPQIYADKIRTKVSQINGTTGVFSYGSDMEQSNASVSSRDSWYDVPTPPQPPPWSPPEQDDNNSSEDEEEFQNATVEGYWSTSAGTLRTTESSWMKFVSTLVSEIISCGVRAAGEWNIIIDRSNGHAGLYSIWRSTSLRTMKIRYVTYLNSTCNICMLNFKCPSHLKVSHI